MKEEINRMRINILMNKFVLKQKCISLTFYLKNDKNFSGHCFYMIRGTMSSVTGAAGNTVADRSS